MTVFIVISPLRMLAENVETSPMGVIDPPQERGTGNARRRGMNIRQLATQLESESPHSNKAWRP